MSYIARFFAVLMALLAIAIAGLMPRAAHAADGLLEPDKAFHFDARLADASHVEVSFDIARGYYMYREQFRFAARGATLGEAVLPNGHVKFDETFQKNVETYRDRVLIELPIAKSSGPFTVSVVSQGCSDKGVCYPPSESHVEVRLTNADGSPGSVRLLPTTPYMPGTDAGSGVGSGAGAGGGLSAALGGLGESLDIARSSVPSGSSGSSVDALSGPVAGSVTDRPGVPTRPVDTSPRTDSSRIGGGIQSALQSGRFASVIGVFLLAGVLLSLTPCVLPMLPILSSIIVGEEARVRKGEGGLTTASSAPSGWTARGRSFGLAASYSLGMALVYTALGVAAGLAGEGLAAALQNPVVLGLFALGLAALSLSMFGVYELQLPAAWTGRVVAASTRIKGGRVLGVFVMGGLSALIVSPCVAAPLAGALVYISQSRDALLGGTALFSLAAGMSVPLLLVGLSAGALLPRAGPWMDGVKRLFGVLLLAVAIWTVQPVLPASLALVLWGALLIGSALALGVLDRSMYVAGMPFRIRKVVAVLLAIFGLMQLVGAASGGSDPLQPLAHLARPTAAASGVASAGADVPFILIKTSSDLDQALRTAGRPVMLDFYADWCVSCKEMERFTFTDAAVKAKLSGALLLKADVTRNSPEDRELLRRFNLFGPPGTLFFDPQGNELAASRVIGFQSSAQFTQTLESVGL